MGRRLAKATIDAVEVAINDPNLFIDIDGTVWRKIGKPDKQGKVTVPYKVPDTPRRYVGIPVQYLVWRKFKGSLPPDNKFLIHKDRNVLNNALENLAIVGEYEFEREFRKTVKQLSFDDIVQMKEDHANGMTVREIVAKYAVAITVTEDVLGLPSSRRHRNRKTRQKKNKEKKIGNDQD